MAKILVIEDDASIRLGLEDTLRAKGYEVVAVGHGECDRIAQRAGGRDIIDDLVSGHADKVIVMLLQVVFGSRRDVSKIFQRLDFCNIDPVFFKELPVERRSFTEKEELLPQFLLLEGFDFV